jgi:hypothetical protein
MIGLLTFHQLTNDGVMRNNAFNIYRVKAPISNTLNEIKQLNPKRYSVKLIHNQRHIEGGILKIYEVEITQLGVRVHRGALGTPIKI